MFGNIEPFREKLKKKLRQNHAQAAGYSNQGPSTNFFAFGLIHPSTFSTVLFETDQSDLTKRVYGY